MNRVEMSAREQAGDLTPLACPRSSDLVACTPALVATAAFVVGTYVATYVRAHYGFDAGIDQTNPVDPGANVSVGDLVHELRKSTIN